MADITDKFATPVFVWITVGVVLLVATMAVLFYTLRKQVLADLGTALQHRAPATRIEQPLRVQAEVEFVPLNRFTALEEDVRRREKEILAHVETLGETMEIRRQEGAAQMEVVRQQIDAKVGQAIAAGNSSARQIHQRMDGLAESLAKVSGGVHESNKTLGLLLDKAMKGNAK